MADDHDVDAQTIDWYWPGRYPSRCSNEFAEAVAWDVANGASLSAAVCKQGISPKRARQWLKWGEDAYFRDANQYDPEAEYLNFYLKVLQAVGIASVPVQQRLYASAPQWWLSHHPEARAGWTDDSEPPQIMAPDAPVVESADSDLQPLPVPELRTVLKTLVDAGAIASQARDVDADETPTERQQEAS